MHAFATPQVRMHIIVCMYVHVLYVMQQRAAPACVRVRVHVHVHVLVMRLDWVQRAATGR